MYSHVLAGATELVYVGAAIAVLLLLISQLRLMLRFRTLDLEVERLKKAHSDGTLDARNRVEEATQALEALEEKVAPRLEGIEPQLDELAKDVSALRPLVGQVEEARVSGANVADAVAYATSRAEQAEETARGVETRLGKIEGGLSDVPEPVARRLSHLESELSALRQAAVTPPATGGADESAREGGPAPTRSAEAKKDQGKKNQGKKDEAGSGTGWTSPATTSLTAGAAIDGAAETEHTDPAHAEVAEPGPGLGLSGALIVVIALAALVLVLRWLILVG